MKTRKMHRLTALLAVVVMMTSVNVHAAETQETLYDTMIRTEEEMRVAVEARDLEAAATAVLRGKMEETKAEFDAATEAAAAAEVSKQSAEKKLQETQADHDALPEALNTAQQEKSAAEADDQAAQTALQEAEATLETVRAACGDIDARLTEAETAETEAEQDRDAKKAAYDQAVAETKTAAADYETATQAAEASKAARDAADAEEAQATDALQTAKETLENKEQALEKAKGAYEEAEELRELGSYGFFQKRGDSAAMAALTDCQYADKIQLGQEEDATALTNMAESFRHMRRLNEIRSSLGLGELMVTSTMMAYAQADADYSDTVVGHAQQFRVGENVAWNYGSDPFRQWYDEEKEFFDAAAESIDGSTGLLGADAYNYYQKHKSDINTFLKEHYPNESVGHYMNDIDPTYQTTGFAVTTRGTMYGWNTYAQVFYYNAGSEEAYTVDAYEAQFQEYLAGIEAAEQTYQQAKEAQTAAAADLEKAQDHLSTCTANYEAARKQYQKDLDAQEAAKADLEQKTAAEQTAQTACQTAEAAYTAAYTEAERVRADAQALAEAETEYLVAKTHQEQTAANLQEKTAAYEEIKERYDRREADLTQAKEAFETARTDLEAKQTAAASTEEAYTAAKAAYEEADGRLQELEATVNEKTQAYQNAKNAYEASLKPKVKTQPKSVTVAKGKTAKFTVKATGTGLKYQWQYSKNNGKTWTKYTGKTSATLSVKASATNNGNQYRCIVKNAAGSVTTAKAKLTVSNVKPRIISQPASASIKSGKKATFKIVAAGKSLKYQWYYSTNKGKTWKKYSGKTAASLTVKGSKKNNGYRYRCVVKNSYGKVTSSSVKLTVK